MKYSRLAIAALAMMALNLSSCARTEKTEETVAEIEAAQMEGRNAAKEFLTRQWKDTLELNKHLLDVRARQSKYTIDKKQKCAEAFDSAFISTMRTVDPALAKELEKHRN